ncbi:response regulator transcription factor [Bacillus sp. ISL-37]|jgi:two-component system, OmpR family, response regulator VicR|uniref:response regulator transcription factor n=1 Tax=Bacillus sp. ISL-37 TaxID=2819123 RepID=UPI001BEC8172|nr:response regulator transcription factor [Bacillus sp. ISL-37]MBT2684985.1 response regulator transcription factor [Bacillus sp. ISL-37]
MDEDLILIVEDEREIAELVRDYLEAEGYRSVLAFDGHDGLSQFIEHRPTVAVLDVMLPRMDGIELCRRIRAESNIPIIIMSAKKSDTDKIIGLGIGADDYVTKPFSPGELVARIKAQLRRFKHLSVPKETENTIRYPGLEINLKEYTVHAEGRPIDLSAKEFQLLAFMAANKGQVFTKEQLLENVWGYQHVGDTNTITVYVRKLREKMEVNPSEPRFIKTVWGIGYKFDGGSQ